MKVKDKNGIERTLSKTATEYLKKNLPDALKCDKVSDILNMLYDFIDEYGFAPPDYYDYNDVGREAQRIYDNICFNLENNSVQ